MYSSALWLMDILDRDFRVCIFARRNFAVRKVCCQVDCIFKCAFTAHSFLEKAFRMLEGLALEAGSKDFELVPCFTVHVIE